MNMIGTFWSLVPPIVAIALALITKEVYSSLFIGIIIGAVFYSVSVGSGLSGFIAHLLNNTVGEGDEAATYGLISCISDSYNVGILVFLVILGTMVALMNKAGGSAAFGNWAKKHIKSKVGAQIATICLGVLIFIDDYFNCLTVGSVMKPVTDKYGVSKEKLAYLIDATAAPVCIIAPISSWAAAVSGFVTEGENGLALFCKAIPFNFYALFTLVMLFCLVFMRFEYGEMSKYEKAKAFMAGEPASSQEAEKSDKNDDSYSTVAAESVAGASGAVRSSKRREGTVLDLVVPIAILIVFCVTGMIYSGGFFSQGESHLNFIEAFANSDASVGLVIGSLAGLILSIIWYLVRNVISFKSAMLCLTDGFKAMVPAILILCLAWTLKSMTDSLGAKDFVAGVVSGSADKLQMLLPAIIFAIACFLAFATGTSWGTFGILIPICIAAFPEGSLRIISISACMAGAVCGDHISPISDTTIMASAGAQCNHVSHVATQIPYAMTVAAVSFVTFIVAGLTSKLNIALCSIISLCFGVALLLAALLFLKKRVEKAMVAESNRK